MARRGPGHLNLLLFGCVFVVFYMIIPDRKARAKFGRVLGQRWWVSLVNLFLAATDRDDIVQSTCGIRR